MASSRTTLTRTATIAAALTTTVILTLTGCSTADTNTATGDDAATTASTTATITDGTLTVCTGDSAPNIYYDDNSELTGVEIDIAKAMSTELGLDLTLEEYSFAGLIPGLQAQQCDVIMGSLYIKPEREEIANFVPYLFSGTAVATAKENPKNITGYDDSLCGARVVVINGATGAAAAEERSALCETEGLDALDITYVDEGVNGIQQVLAGQGDAWIDTTEIVSYYEQQTDGDFTMVGDAFGKIRIGAASLKDNTELNEALGTAFDSIVENGTYGEILTTWGVETNDITVGE